MLHTCKTPHQIWAQHDQNGNTITMASNDPGNRAYWHRVLVPAMQSVAISLNVVHLRHKLPVGSRDLLRSDSLEKTAHGRDCLC
jgi:hypothetical protein